MRRRRKRASSVSSISEKVLQTDDFVAVLSSLKEVEILCRLFHQRCRISNTLAQLFFTHVAKNGIGGDRHRIGFNIRNVWQRLCVPFILCIGRCGETALSNGFHNLLGRNAVLLIVTQLFRAATKGFVDGLLHTGGNGVGIHNNLSVDIAGGTSGRLRQRAVAAQKAFFVGIENCNKRHLGKVKTLA